MGTHIIWRNPSPPARVKFKLRRVVRDDFASVYQVASPNYRHPFEVVHTGRISRARIAANKTELAPLSAGTELVLARW